MCTITLAAYYNALMSSSVEKFVAPAGCNRVDAGLELLYVGVVYNIQQLMPAALDRDSAHGGRCKGSGALVSLARVTPG